MGVHDFTRLAGRGMLVQLALLASGPLLARLLGPEGRGELALAMAVGLMFSQGVMGGTAVAVAHAVAGSRAPARRILGPHLRRWAWHGLATGGAAGLTTWLLLGRTGSGAALQLGLAVAVLATLSAWAQVVGAMLRGEGNVRYVTLLPIIGVMIYVVGVVACFLLAPGVGAAVVALIYVVGQLVGLQIGWRALRADRGEPADVAERRSLGSMARRSWATAVNTLGLGFDQLVVVLVLGTHSLGLYAVAVSITNVPAMALRSVASMLMPRLVAMGPTAARATARRWLVAAAGLDLLLVVGLEIVIGPVIRILFGDDFAPAIPAARIIIIAWGFMAYRLMLTAVLQAQGRAGAASVVEIVATVFLAGACVAGAKLAGLEGVAVALTATSIVACLAAATQLRWTEGPRHPGRSVRPGASPRPPRPAR